MHPACLFVWWRWMPSAAIPTDIRRNHGPLLTISAAVLLKDADGQIFVQALTRLAMEPIDPTTGRTREVSVCQADGSTSFVWMENTASGKQPQIRGPLKERIEALSGQTKVIVDSYKARDKVYSKASLVIIVLLVIDSVVLAECSGYYRLLFR